MQNEKKRAVRNIVCLSSVGYIRNVGVVKELPNCGGGVRDPAVQKQQQARQQSNKQKKFIFSLVNIVPYSCARYLLLSLLPNCYSQHSPTRVDINKRKKIRGKEKLVKKKNLKFLCRGIFLKLTILRKRTLYSIHTHIESLFIYIRTFLLLLLIFNALSLCVRLLN